MVFGLSKGWCVFFYYFGTVLQSVVCLLLICTVCWIYLFFHFFYGVALAWILFGHESWAFISHIESVIVKYD